MSSPAPVTRMLGKLPVKHDAKTLFLSEVVLPEKLLPAPEPFDYLAPLPEDLGTYGNDVAGNCTCAAIFHMLQAEAAACGDTPFSNEEGLRLSMDLYKEATELYNGRAYDPNDPNTDTGLALLDVLNLCRKKGLIGAFVKLRHTDLRQIEIGGKLFGGLYTGVMLPTDAQAQLDNSDIWTPTDGPGGEPGGWGGHAMYMGKGGPDETYVTWGRRRRAIMQWVAKYTDEMYATISKTWVTGDRPAPSGFDIVKLREFLGAL